MEKFKTIETIKTTVGATAEKAIKDTGALGKKFYKFVQDNEVFWMVLAFFLMGVIIGMVCSPHRDFAIGCNNKATNIENDKKDCEDDEDCCCGKEC